MRGQWGWGWRASLDYTIPPVQTKASVQVLIGQCSPGSVSRCADQLSCALTHPLLLVHVTHPHCMPVPCFLVTPQPNLFPDLERAPQHRLWSQLLVCAWEGRGGKEERERKCIGNQMSRGGGC